MAYRSFRQFLDALEKAGELKRVAIPVDTELLVAEWADREMKSPGGGKALLFEQPVVDGKKSEFPIAINALGSRRRMAMTWARPAIIWAGMMEYWSDGGGPLRTSLQHSITPPLHHSSNESPMREKWPINKQPATDQIFEGNRSPIAAVVTVITIITHAVGLAGDRALNLRNLAA